MRIHVYDINENAKKTIVFFHAFPLDSQMWKEQLFYFSKNYRCICVDFPGFGESRLPDYPATFEYFVEAIEKALMEKKIKPATWCGLSMGGYLALRLFERNSQLCNALILADTKASADGNEAKQNRFRALKQLFEDREAFFESQWAALFASSRKDDMRLKEAFREIVNKQSTRAVAQGIISLATRSDTTENLSSINVPTLIIVGSEDKVTPLKDAEALKESISSSRLELIQGAGHLSSLEEPQKFNDVVDRFVGAL